MRIEVHLLMKVSLILGICLLFFLEPVQALTLTEAYRSALESRGPVQIAELNRQISKAQKQQAVGSLLPRLSAGFDASWEEEETSSTNNRRTESFQHSSRLSAEQPLFQGGAEYFGLIAANRREEQKSLELQEAKLSLFAQVAEIFLDAYMSSELEKSLQEQVEILEQQKAYFEKRVQTGESRKVDLSSTSSELARARADLSEIQSQRIENFRRLEWAASLSEISKLEHEFHLSGPLDEDLALSNNPTLKKLDRIIASLKAEKKALQGDFLPKVNATGDYFLHQKGVGNSSDWAISLNATWEFFSGFQSLKRVEVKGLEVRRAIVELIDFQAEIEAEAQSLQKSLQQRQGALEELEAAVSLSREVYEAQRRDLGLNLVSQLEVLRSLETYIENRIHFEEQRVALELAWIQLQLLQGQTP